MKDKRVDEPWTALAESAARHAGSLHLDSVRSELAGLKEQIRVRHPCIDRIAFALFDQNEGTLKGMLSVSEDGPCPIYVRPLADVPSLAQLAQDRTLRVVDDLAQAFSSGSEHTRWLQEQGFRSSLTIPVEQDDRLLGFLFFDSLAPAAFGPRVVDDLRLLAHLIAIIIRQQLASVEMLIRSLRFARRFTHLRDIETGCHLDRMSAYASLIAREMAPSEGVDPDFVELLSLFAPLHDIGKIGVPDSILKKPGPLNPQERIVMDSHVNLGLTIAERFLADFGLESLPSVSMLRNVIAHHHELLDGSGYPGRLAGSEIPLEARIAAAADVLDALVCKRSYKPAWTVQAAFDEVSRMAGSKLDENCVGALLRCRDEVEAIHDAMAEDA